MQPDKNLNLLDWILQNLFIVLSQKKTLTNENIFLIVCHAAATITVSPNSAVTGTNNGAIYSAGGLTLPSDGELHVASIYLSLSEQSSDLSYLYMSIVNAVKFSVLFLSDETGYTEVGLYTPCCLLFYLSILWAIITSRYRVLVYDFN